MVSILSSLRVRAVDSERIQDFTAIQQTSLLYGFLFLTPDAESTELLANVKVFHERVQPTRDQLAYIQLFHTGGKDHSDASVEFISEGHDNWYVGEGVDDLLQSLRANFSVQRSGPVFVVTNREGVVIDGDAGEAIKTRTCTALSDWIRASPPKPSVPVQPKYVPLTPAAGGKKIKKKGSKFLPPNGAQPQNPTTNPVAFGQFVGWTGKTRQYFGSPSGPSLFPPLPHSLLTAGAHPSIEQGNPVVSGRYVKLEVESHEEDAAGMGGNVAAEGEKISYEEFRSRLAEKLLSRDPDFGAPLIEEDWVALCKAVTPGEINYEEIASCLLDAALNRATRATTAVRFLTPKPRDEKSPCGRLKSTFLALVQKTLEDHHRPAIIRVITRFYEEGLMDSYAVCKTLTFLWEKAFKEGADPEIALNCLFLLELTGRQLQGDPFWRPLFDYGGIILDFISDQELPSETRNYCDELAAFRRNGWARIDTKFGEKPADLTISTKFRTMGANKQELAALSVRIQTYLESLEQWSVTQALCAHLVLEYLYHGKFTDETIFACSKRFLARLTGLIEALLILSDILEIEGFSDYVSGQLFHRRCPEPCVTCCGRFFFSLQMGLKHQDYRITLPTWQQFNAIKPATSLHAGTYDPSAFLRALQ